MPCSTCGGILITETLSNHTRMCSCGQKIEHAGGLDLRPEPFPALTDPFRKDVAPINGEGIRDAPQKGDYVLATKYPDGLAGDQWCVGILGKRLERYTPAKFKIVDSEGRSFGGNGFRRVERITRKEGAYLLAECSGLEEANPCHSIWDVLNEYRKEMRPPVATNQTESEMDKSEAKRRAHSIAAKMVERYLDLVDFGDNDEDLSPQDWARIEDALDEIVQYHNRKSEK